MEELETSMTKGKGKLGDHDAYETTARRFQDMAMGDGYAPLGDMGLAEDVEQEVFSNAF